MMAKEPDVFFFQCWKCGTLVPLHTLEPIVRIYCSDCKEKHYNRLEKVKRIYKRLRAEIMFERALSILEYQNLKMFLYREAAEAIFEKMKERKIYFDSAHEIVAAIELLRNRIRIKIQPTIDDMRPDILLPDEKVVLEVDGFLHRGREYKDFNRDRKLRKILGPDWEVIHIPTKYIESNITMLPVAIRELKAYQKQIRAENGGIMPEWYSKRNAAAWKKIKKLAKSLNT